MKNYILVILSFTLIFISCSTKRGLLFEFDEVVHYSKDATNLNFKSYFDCNTGKQLEDFGCDIIHDSRPTDITDISFLDSLKLLGFIQHQIDSSNFNNLRSIFTEKNPPLISPSSVSACAPIYRDILIFKMRDTVTGVAKICFECSKKRIIGISGKQVADFDFNTLGSILNKNR